MSFRNVQVFFFSCLVCCASNERGFRKDFVFYIGVLVTFPVLVVVVVTGVCST